MERRNFGLNSSGSSSKSSGSSSKELRDGWLIDFSDDGGDDQDYLPELKVPYVDTSEDEEDLRETLRRPKGPPVSLEQYASALPKTDRMRQQEAERQKKEEQAAVPIAFVNNHVVPPGHPPLRAYGHPIPRISHLPRKAPRNHKTQSQLDAELADYRINGPVFSTLAERELVFRRPRITATPTIRPVALLGNCGMPPLNYGIPIHNPDVPFSYEVPGALPNYGMFLLDGFVPFDSQGFAVNIQLGPAVNPRDDVALHLGFRFSPAPHLSVNSIKANQWGTNLEYANCPLRKMDPFQIHILVQSRSFMIALNNEHFCEFPHRMDPALIRAVAVDGNVVLNLLQLEFPGGLQSVPSPRSSPTPQSSAPFYDTRDTRFPPMPSPSHAAVPVYSSPAVTSNNYVRQPPPVPVYSSPAESSNDYGRQPQPVPAQQKNSTMQSAKNLLTSPAALGALSSVAAMAAPLFYPGMKKKMKHKGNKQRGMFGGGMPFMGGMGSGGGYGSSSGTGAGLGGLLSTVGSMVAGSRSGHGGHGYGHGHNYGHGGSYLMPGLGLGAGALGGAGLGYAMGHGMGHHGHHGHNWGYDRRSSSSSFSDSD